MKLYPCKQKFILMKSNFFLKLKDIIASSFVTHVKQYSRLQWNANFFMFSSMILKLRTSIDLNQVLILNIYDNNNFWAELSRFVAMLNFLHSLLLQLNSIWTAWKKLLSFHHQQACNTSLYVYELIALKLEFEDWDCHNFYVCFKFFLE